jgi:hypothetical protein
MGHDLREVQQPRSCARLYTQSRVSWQLRCSGERDRSETLATAALVHETE